MKNNETKTPFIDENSEQFQLAVKKYIAKKELEKQKKILNSEDDIQIILDNFPIVSNGSYYNSPCYKYTPTYSYWSTTLDFKNERTLLKNSSYNDKIPKMTLKQFLYFNVDLKKYENKINFYIIPHINDNGEYKKIDQYRKLYKAYTLDKIFINTKYKNIKWINEKDQIFKKHFKKCMEQEYILNKYYK